MMQPPVCPHPVVRARLCVLSRAHKSCSAFRCIKMLVTITTFALPCFLFFFSASWHHLPEDDWRKETSTDRLPTSLVPHVCRCLEMESWKV